MKNFHDLTPEEAKIAEYYENLNDEQNDEIDLKADAEGKIARGVSFEESVKLLDEKVRMFNAEKKPYTFRLKVSVVNAIKKKAKEAGMPYQTYVNRLLEAAAAQ